MKPEVMAQASVLAGFQSESFCIFFGVQFLAQARVASPFVWCVSLVLN